MCQFINVLIYSKGRSLYMGDQMAECCHLGDLNVNVGCQKSTELALADTLIMTDFMECCRHLSILPSCRWQKMD